MSSLSHSSEFRFHYSTPLYSETISFYKNDLQLEEARSWDRGDGDKGSIFRSPNGTGLIEILQGNETPVIQGELYIEVEDPDIWHDLAIRKKLNIVQTIHDTSYGHRAFKVKDPGGLVIGFFRYI